MSETNVIRCYQYVTSPYEAVRDALKRDAPALFQRATVEATARAQSLVSNLRVRVGGLEIGADVIIKVVSVEEEADSPSLHAPRTRLLIEWRAAQASALFPSMKGELSVYALSPFETQIDWSGRYEPPLGVIGAALDALVGHRIAEASVLRFVEDVAAQLRVELTKAG